MTNHPTNRNDDHAQPALPKKLRLNERGGYYVRDDTMDFVELLRAYAKLLTSDTDDDQARADLLDKFFGEHIYETWENTYFSTFEVHGDGYKAEITITSPWPPDSGSVPDDAHDDLRRLGDDDWAEHRAMIEEDEALRAQLDEDEVS